MIYNSYLTGNVTDVDLHGYLTNANYRIRLDTPFVSELKVCFSHNDRLEYVRLDNCSQIEYSAFAFCSNLSYVWLPQLSGFDKNAFQECTCLQSLILPNVSTIHINGCLALSYLEIPRVTSLDEYNIKRFITGTERYDDRDYQLHTVKLQSCSMFYRSVFYGCSRLTSLYLLSSRIVRLSSLNGLYSPIRKTSDLTIYVPSSLISAYVNDSLWRSAVGSSYLLSHLSGV